MPKPKDRKEKRDLARNRKALHDFEIEETYEAGIVLVGSEVKSLRAGRANLRDSYARFQGLELWLEGVHINPYPQAGLFNHDPLRNRKILMHRRELKKLKGRVEQRGYTLVPLALYLKQGRVKVTLGLAHGKRQYDKREKERRRTQEREAERDVKEYGGR